MWETVILENRKFKFEEEQKVVRSFNHLLSDKPPVRWSNSGAKESSEIVAAVTLSLENCSCSQATYNILVALANNQNIS